MRTANRETESRVFLPRLKHAANNASLFNPWLFVRHVRPV